ncbi:hypothetical protein CHLNCDRAFT_133552 [Chlorella variabilis]|uniref:Patatin n=1 Tax=Chlorella variabilis TaxID=554065 RepID=E1Z3B7_CHLVA|nr:hypothetical protein CHLNCDRAFT_133552 [Chlorella variabilis]EFN59813.1 hypothetical protein CHLNCDRAFT_133552 [Chlorella variabilis]|eukprot:XP_005851915.1 hypothetical protein CHLNCDRAFT_133552 [Chlorella variabilis]
MWFYWKAGVLKYLQQHHDLAAVRLHGSSSGAMVAVLAASGVDLERAAERAGEVFTEHGVHDRLFGLLGVWGSIARRCLEELLPEDAHTRCTGRVRLRITAWPSLSPLFLERFHSKADLIDACMASSHLPFLLDGRLAARVRGVKAMDGAFCRWAWMMRQPGGLRRLLSLGVGTIGGDPVPSAAPQALEARDARPPSARQQAGAAQHAAASFMLDYTFDEALGPLRLRFGAVRLRTAEGLQQLVRSGFEYGQRLHTQGVWATWLGGAPPSRQST